MSGGQTGSRGMEHGAKGEDEKIKYRKKMGGGEEMGVMIRR